jgi:uncharacterized protein
MKVNVFDHSLSNIADGAEQHIPPVRFSRFVHQFERECVAGLYHSLTHQLLFLPANDYQELKKEIHENDKIADIASSVKDLIRLGFLVSQNYKEDRILEEVRNSFLGKPAFGILYLLLTDACNLRCRYCFVEGAMSGSHIFSEMSIETAIRGINIFAECLKKNPLDTPIENPTIIFYGGEPLLNKRAFLAALGEVTRLKALGQLPPATSVSIITNATIIDDDVLKAISVNNVSVAVSIDGPREIHDANRVFTNKQGTFTEVVRNFRRLQEAGINPSISCTINPWNVDSLQEIFRWMISELKIKGLGFNLLVDLPEIAQSNEAYAKKATDSIIACYQIAREKGIYEDRIMRKVNAFITKSLHLADCGGYGNQIVIAPNGRIGPCHGFMSSERYWPGHVDNQSFNPFEDTVFVEWSKRSPFNISKCHSCYAIGICGGGCAYNAELKHGNIWDIDSNFCVHTKTILEWLVWDLYEQTQRRS